MQQLIKSIPPKPFRTLKLSQVQSAARNLANRLQGGEIIGLVGPLGSGKTTFTQAVARHLGVEETVTSPTFTLLNVYPTKRHTATKQPLFLLHWDIYRTQNFSELRSLDIEQWGDMQTITIIEWADIIAEHMPKKTVWFNFN